MCTRGRDGCCIAPAWSPSARSFILFGCFFPDGLTSRPGRTQVCLPGEKKSLVQHEHATPATPLPKSSPRREGMNGWMPDATLGPIRWVGMATAFPKSQSRSAKQKRTLSSDGAEKSLHLERDEKRQGREEHA